MTRTPATPAEYASLSRLLAPVPGDRHAAIARMVFEEVATCPTCHEPVRRCDPRRLIRGQFGTWNAKGLRHDEANKFADSGEGTSPMSAAKPEIVFSETRRALSPAHAAAALDMSEDTFTRYVAPELKWVRLGRKRIVSIEELDRYLRENASRALDGRAA